MDITVSGDGILTWNEKQYRCSIGTGGVSSNKIEGDGATPIGCFQLREVLYRADRVSRPITVLSVSPIKEQDGWCDDTTVPFYNAKIVLPNSAHHEILWREDEIYNIIVPLGYNDAPAVPGKGSAIFMHLARPGYTPTEGCIALSLADLLEILKEISSETQICIK